MVLTKRNKIAGAVAVAVLAVGGIAYATLGAGDSAKSQSAGSHGPGPGGPGGGRGPGGPGGPGGIVTQVSAVEAAPKTFNVKVEALGTLEPRERVVLTANAADRVTGVFFEDGQRVAKGKTLMTLVSDQENAELESARHARQLQARLRAQPAPRPERRHRPTRTRAHQVGLRSRRGQRRRRAGPPA